MSKTIPAALQTHYNEAVNTTCLLLRIDKNVGANGTPASIGLAVFDQALTYDDGDGSLTYSAIGGWQPSSLFTGGDLSVDNAEAEVLIPAYDLGPMVEEEIRAGVYDDAPFRLYRVNWKDLTAGRHELVMYGTIGQVKTINGLSCFAELRGPQHQLKQSGIGVTSVTCRVKQFGSQNGEELYPCKYNAAGLWVNGTVTGVGSESDLVFDDTGRGEADDYFAPGLVEWLTGDNAGRTSEVETFASDIFTLRFATPYEIQIGDTYRARPDCTRNWEGHNSCETYNNRLNFRGEPKLPMGDGGRISSPGASRPAANRAETADDVFNP